MNRPTVSRTLPANRRTVGPGSLGLLLLMGLPWAPDEVVSQIPPAKEIMEKVYEQDTNRDVTMRIKLQVFGRSGEPERKRFVLYRVGSPGQSKTLARFTSPPELRGVALLSINRKGEAVSQWIFTPATRRTRKVAPRDRSESFAGTDFSYEDITERALDDFSYRLVDEADAMEGHKTYKIEATPVAPDRSQYKFVYYWVAQDVPVILHAEMYGQQGQQVRRFHASQLKRVSGIWGARRLEMTSLPQDTRTTLTIDEVRFNTGLGDDLFAPEALEKGGLLPPKN